MDNCNLFTFGYGVVLRANEKNLVDWFLLAENSLCLWVFIDHEHSLALHTGSVFLLMPRWCRFARRIDPSDSVPIAFTYLLILLRSIVPAILIMMVPWKASALLKRSILGKMLEVC